MFFLVDQAGKMWQNIADAAEENLDTRYLL